MSDSTTSAPSIQDRIRHEETMIYNRITWMLTFQGFLFASLAIASDASTDEHIRSVLLGTIPLLGVAVGVLTLLGVSAAYIHMHEIRATIQTKEDGKDFGAKGLARWMGRSNSGLLPVIIVIAWLYLYYALP